MQCYPEALRAPFAHLVLKEELFNAIGPAIVSGQSRVHLRPAGQRQDGHGPVHRRLHEHRRRRRSTSRYAFIADGNIITVLRPVAAHVVDDTPTEFGDEADAAVRRLLNTGTVDPRWVRIRRPVIVTGGELNLDMLDLRYNAEANFYQAPLHVKANGGVFLIDDFGRQLVQPEGTAQSLDSAARRPARLPDRGHRQEVPGAVRAADHLLDQPRPEGPGGRRLPAAHPAQGRHPRPARGTCTRRSSRRCASGSGMNSCPEAVDYLYERYYNQGRTPRASDCRDLLEIVQSICRYRRQPVHLTRDLIAEASASFIAEFQ